MSLPPVGIHVGELPGRAARRVPDRTAVVSGTVRLHYRDLADRVSRLARALRTLGCEPGSRVALLAHNGLEALELCFAVPLAGASLVPLNTRFSRAELAGCLRASECRLVLTTEELAVNLPADAPAPVVLDQATSSGHTAYHDLVADHTPLSEAPTPAPIPYIYFTSGSSGRPKGVMLSHDNVIAGGLNCAAAVEFGSSSTWLHSSPMFHLADAWAIWGATMLGARHVVERFHPERTVAALRRERISHTLLVPTALEMLAERTDRADHPFDSLTGLLYGGAPITETTFRRLYQDFAAPLVHTYGTTETSGCITALPGRELLDADGSPRLSTIGREAPLTEVRLIDGDGRAVPDGSPGEIAVRSPSVMRGYLGEPTLTSRSLVEGRYLTGDLGIREPDGCLRLVGRKKEMLISGGENVYPSEVEGAIRRHAAVRDAAVTGVPDRRWGQRVVALAVLRDGARLDAEGLREFLADRLASFKIPKSLYLVDRLPYTGNGKLDRHRVQSVATELAIPDDGASSP